VWERNLNDDGLISSPEPGRLVELPVARSVPSGLNATANTLSVCAVKAVRLRCTVVKKDKKTVAVVT
jgi:hypothetical protein